MAESRTAAAHDVSSSTVDEFLDPSSNGDFSNDSSTLHANAGLIHVYEYNASGDRTDRKINKIKQGRSGTGYYVSAVDYHGGTNELHKHLVTATYEYPVAVTSRTATSRITTQFAYTFWAGTDTIKTKTTTYASVPTNENGSGSQASRTLYYDTLRRVRWEKDEIGVVTYYSYHPKHGHLAYSVRDADPDSLPSSADSNDTKWITSSAGLAWILRRHDRERRSAGSDLVPALHPT